MPAIITGGTVCAGGGHITSVTVNVDGEIVNIPLVTVDADGALTAEELQVIVPRFIGKLLAQGVTPAQMIGRIIGFGEEATNMKPYSFFGPGVALTKTNIGTAYVNVPIGLNGERILVDFTGCTEFRAFLNANLVATGPFQVRIVRDGDNAVLYESPSIPLTGERELDSDWTAIPAGFDGLTLLRMQMKSGTASDDPIARRGGLLVR